MIRRYNIPQKDRTVVTPETDHGSCVVREPPHYGAITGIAALELNVRLRALEEVFNAAKAARLEDTARHAMELDAVEPQYPHTLKISCLSRTRLPTIRKRQSSSMMN